MSESFLRTQLCLLSLGGHWQEAKNSPRSASLPTRRIVYLPEERKQKLTLHPLPEFLLKASECFTPEMKDLCLKMRASEELAPSVSEKLKMNECSDLVTHLL